MKRETFHLWPALEKDWGISQARRVGNTIWLSGTVSLNEAGNVVHPEDITAQTRQIYQNISKSLAHFGATLADVVEETIFILDMDQVNKVIEARNEMYRNCEAPCCAAIGAARLQLQGLLLEIKCSAQLQG